MQPARISNSATKQATAPVLQRSGPVTIQTANTKPALNKTIPRKNSLAGKILTSSATLQPEMTVCFDTSGRYFLSNDTMYYYVAHSTLLSDGSIAASGEAFSVSRNLSGGFMMKLTDSGTLKWVKVYDSLGRSSFSFVNYQRVLELRDGTFILAGLTNDPSNYDNDIIVTHVNQSGNILWTQNYKSRLWNGHSNSDHFFIHDIKQDPNSDDVFFTGNHWVQGKNITRIHTTDGSVVWSNFYQSRGWAFDYPLGLDVRPSDIMLFSRFNHDYLGVVISVFKVDKATGDTIASKYYAPIDPTHYNLSIIHPDDFVKLNNGNYGLTGKHYKSYRFGADTTDLYHGTVMEFDNDGDFKNAFSFRNKHESNLYNTRVTLQKDGSGTFSMLDYISGWQGDIYYVQFKNGQITRQRKRHYGNEGMPLESRSVRVADGGDVFIKMVSDSVVGTSKVEFLKLHISDTASTCLGVDDHSTYIEPYKIEKVQLGFDSIGVNDFFISKRKQLTVFNETMRFDPACRQVSNCDTISLHASADTVCVGSPLFVTVRKNAGCGAIPFMNFDTSIVREFRQVNDSVYRFVFSNASNTRIAASIEGCTLIEDAVTVVVVASKGAVSLGEDKQMCPGNIFELKAGPGYSSYVWQDGSTDSVLLASVPGTYHVRVTDYCGNPFTDTLIISSHAPVPFSLGNDITICRNDSAVISGPGSFINYQWSPAYRINSQNAQTVRVSPLKDTAYYVSAEKTGGCIVYDTINVYVREVAAVELGNDVSFCNGDSAIADAGQGFASYKWSNGATTRSIVLRSEGKYAVIGTDANGCRARDTIVVLKVHDNPQPMLPGDDWICEGTSLTVDPGNFQYYKWNTGSEARTLTVSGPGEYAVVVKDENGCVGQGKMNISRSIVPPHDFLSADTVICNYGTNIIKPLGEYSAYQWSTGSSANNISVTRAGDYWLQVTDDYNCVGRDTIQVSVKDCLQGFYIPNAFTPNGKNRSFKPMIFGEIEKYEFIIFNRWGQVVFKSTDPSKGWDGRYGNDMQNNETFIWICRYKLANEPMKEEKGVVLLIR